MNELTIDASYVFCIFRRIEASLIIAFHCVLYLRYFFLMKFWRRFLLAFDNINFVKENVAFSVYRSIILKTEPKLIEPFKNAIFPEFRLIFQCIFQSALLPYLPEQR